MGRIGKVVVSICGGNGTHLAGLDVPKHQTVIVGSTEGSQELVIAREAQTLNLDLVKDHLVNNLEGFKVPENDLSGVAHVGLLPRGEILPGATQSKAGHLKKYKEQVRKGQYPTKKLHRTGRVPCLAISPS